MGRKPKNPIVKCGKILEDGSICGKPSYLRQVKTRNTRSGNDQGRLYEYWVHIEQEEGQPKKHYKGPADPSRAELAHSLARIREHKNEAERIRYRRFNYPPSIPKETLRKKPETVNDYIKSAVDRVRNQHISLSKKHKKLARLLYRFPLSPENDKKASEFLLRYMEKAERLDRKSRLSIDVLKNNIYEIKHDPKLSTDEKAEAIAFNVAMIQNISAIYETILARDNAIMEPVTDERSGETLLGWSKIAKDKFEYGIGGTASRNSILTGYHIMRLGKIQKGDEYPKSVKIIPIARKLTPKHIENKTRLEIPDNQNQIAVKCSKCGEDITGKKVPDEVIDSIGQDFFTEVINGLENDPLSKAVEIVYNNVSTEIRRSPQDFYVKQIKKIYKKTPTQQEINSVKVIEVKEPEYMKTNNIDPSTVYKFTYSIKQGISARHLHLSERLSEHS